MSRRRRAKATVMIERTVPQSAATVALVEGGLRQVSVGELLTLPVVFRTMIEKVLNSPSSNLEKWPKLADFLPESGLCEVTRGCTLSASVCEMWRMERFSRFSFPRIIPLHVKLMKIF